MKNNKIKFGIPSARLMERTESIFKGAGYNIQIDEKSSMVSLDDPEVSCFLARPEEIAQLVHQEVLDGGVTSRVALTETDIRIPEICDLGSPIHYGEESKVALAVPNNSKVTSIRDLQGKRIITRMPGITKAFLRKNKIKASVIYSEGTNEAKVSTFADAIVEFFVTGSLFKSYNLKIVTILMNDSLVLVASRKALKNAWQKEKIENLKILLKGAELAQKYSGVMLHVPTSALQEVLRILPSLKKPTITLLENKLWFDVFTVAKKKELRQLFPILKKLGCADMVEFPLNKVVL